MLVASRSLVGPSCRAGTCGAGITSRAIALSGAGWGAGRAPEPLRARAPELGIMASGRGMVLLCPGAAGAGGTPPAAASVASGVGTGVSGVVAGA